MTGKNPTVQTKAPPPQVVSPLPPAHQQNVTRSSSPATHSLLRGDASTPSASSTALCVPDGSSAALCAPDDSNAAFCALHASSTALCAPDASSTPLCVPDVSSVALLASDAANGNPADSGLRTAVVPHSCDTSNVVPHTASASGRPCSDLCETLCPPVPQKTPLNGMVPSNSCEKLHMTAPSDDRISSSSCKKSHSAPQTTLLNGGISRNVCQAPFLVPQNAPSNGGISFNSSETLQLVTQITPSNGDMSPSRCKTPHPLPLTASLDGTVPLCNAPHRVPQTTLPSTTLSSRSVDTLHPVPPRAMPCPPPLNSKRPIRPAPKRPPPLRNTAPRHEAFRHKASPRAAMTPDDILQLPVESRPRGFPAFLFYPAPPGTITVPVFPPREHPASSLNSQRVVEPGNAPVAPPILPIEDRARQPLDIRLNSDGLPLTGLTISEWKHAHHKPIDYILPPGRHGIPHSVDWLFSRCDTFFLQRDSVTRDVEHHVHHQHVPTQPLRCVPQDHDAQRSSSDSPRLLFKVPPPNSPYGVFHAPKSCATRPIAPTQTPPADQSVTRAGPPPASPPSVLPGRERFAKAALLGPDLVSTTAPPKQPAKSSVPVPATRPTQCKAPPLQELRREVQKRSAKALQEGNLVPDPATWQTCDEQRQWISSHPHVLYAPNPGFGVPRNFQTTICRTTTAIPATMVECAHGALELIREKHHRVARNVETNFHGSDTRAFVKIGLCMTVMNRYFQVKLALPISLANMWKHRQWVQFYIVDFDSNDGVSDYILDTFPEAIREGFVKLFHTRDMTFFHASVCKNTAHRMAIEDACAIVVNLDADNIVGPNFGRDILSAYWKDEADVVHFYSGDSTDGTYGRIACFAADFDYLRGYEEDMCPTAKQDCDLLARLRLLGRCILGQSTWQTLSWKDSHVDRSNIAAIPNDKSETIKNVSPEYRHMTWRTMDRRNGKEVNDLRAKGKIVRNHEKTQYPYYGCVNVTRQTLESRYINATPRRKPPAPLRMQSSSSGPMAQVPEKVSSTCRKEVENRDAKVSRRSTGVAENQHAASSSRVGVAENKHAKALFSNVRVAKNQHAASSSRVGVAENRHAKALFSNMRVAVNQQAASSSSSTTVAKNQRLEASSCRVGHAKKRSAEVENAPDMAARKNAPETSLGDQQGAQHVQAESARLAQPPAVREASSKLWTHEATHAQDASAVHQAAAPKTPSKPLTQEAIHCEPESEPLLDQPESQSKLSKDQSGHTTAMETSQYETNQPESKSVLSKDRSADVTIVDTSKHETQGPHEDKLSKDQSERIPTTETPKRETKLPESKDKRLNDQSTRTARAKASTYETKQPESKSKQSKSHLQRAAATETSKHETNQPQSKNKLSKDESGRTACTKTSKRETEQPESKSELSKDRFGYTAATETSKRETKQPESTRKPSNDQSGSSAATKASAHETKQLESKSKLFKEQSRYTAATETSKHGTKERETNSKTSKDQSWHAAATGTSNHGMRQVESKSTPSHDGSADARLATISTSAVQSSYGKAEDVCAGAHSERAWHERTSWTKPDKRDAHSDWYRNGWSSWDKKSNDWDGTTSYYDSMTNDRAGTAWTGRWNDTEAPKPGLRATASWECGTEKTCTKGWSDAQTTGAVPRVAASSTSAWTARSKNAAQSDNVKDHEETWSRQPSNGVKAEDCAISWWGVTTEEGLKACSRANSAERKDDARPLSPSQCQKQRGKWQPRKTRGGKAGNSRGRTLKNAYSDWYRNGWSSWEKKSNDWDGTTSYDDSMTNDRAGTAWTGGWNDTEAPKPGLRATASWKCGTEKTCTEGWSDAQTTGSVPRVAASSTSAWTARSKNAAQSDNVKKHEETWSRRPSNGVKAEDCEKSWWGVTAKEGLKSCSRANSAERKDDARPLSPSQCQKQRGKWQSRKTRGGTRQSGRGETLENGRGLRNNRPSSE